MSLDSKGQFVLDSGVVAYWDFRGNVPRTAGRDLTPAERREIADCIIQRWEHYARTGESLTPPIPYPT